jgi:nitrous-oxide reductase
MVVNKGDTVNVQFYNTDSTELHSFTIGMPYKIDKDVEGGQNATVTFTADQAGVFQYYCKYHLPTMTGQLVVMP